MKITNKVFSMRVHAYCTLHISLMATYIKIIYIYEIAFEIFLHGYTYNGIYEQSRSETDEI